VPSRKPSPAKSIKAPSTEQQQDRIAALWKAAGIDEESLAPTLNLYKGRIALSD
jgi:hypothetical protein